MKEKLLNWIKKHKILLFTILSGLIGMSVFVIIYGYKVLNVTDDTWLHASWLHNTWLYPSGDLTQHYYGWVSFRNSDWTFPLGLFNTLSYPNYASIMFTDSIPLFAIIFKAISFILPETFQYFGIFGLMCYVLQGIFAFTLLRKFINNKFYVMVRNSIFYRFSIYTTKNVLSYCFKCEFLDTCFTLSLGI